MIKQFITFSLIAALIIFAGCQGTNNDMIMSDISEEQPSSTVPEKTADAKTRPANESQAPPPAAEVRQEKSETKPSAKPQKNGVLSVDTDVYNFGSVEPKGSATGQFTLTNSGEGVLEIQRIHASCGCTATTLKSKVLKPGESTPLSVTYNAGTQPGPVSKTISVFVNAPGKPSKKILRITGNIRDIVAVEPENHNFELRQDADLEYTLTLKSLEDKPFNIISVTAVGDVAEAAFDKEASKTSHDIVIKGNMENLYQTPNGYISIRTNHAKAERITARFSTIKPFDVHPPSRVLRDIKPGEPQEGTFKVVSNFKEDFEIEEIVSENGFIKKGDITRTDDGYQVSYTATLPEDSSKSYIHDNLTVTIKDHPMATLKVSFFGRMSRTSMRR